MQAELDNNQKRAEEQAKHATAVAQAAVVIASDKDLQSAVQQLFSVVAQQQASLLRLGKNAGLNTEDSAALADEFSRIFLKGLAKGASAANAAKPF